MASILHSSLLLEAAMTLNWSKWQIHIKALIKYVRQQSPILSYQVEATTGCWFTSETPTIPDNIQNVTLVQSGFLVLVILLQLYFWRDLFSQAFRRNTTFLYTSFQEGRIPAIVQQYCKIQSHQAALISIAISET
jgi:hypothetical protein